MLCFLRRRPVHCTVCENPGLSSGYVSTGCGTCCVAGHARRRGCRQWRVDACFTSPWVNIRPGLRVILINPGLPPPSPVGFLLKRCRYCFSSVLCVFTIIVLTSVPVRAVDSAESVCYISFGFCLGVWHASRIRCGTATERHRIAGLGKFSTSRYPSFRKKRHR